MLSEIVDRQMFPVAVAVGPDCLEAVCECTWEGGMDVYFLGEYDLGLVTQLHES